jgi:hypothetical protein
MVVLNVKSGASAENETGSRTTGHPTLLSKAIEDYVFGGLRHR